MYVSKTHRGLGLGKKLFARLLSRYLKRKDIGLIRLQVVSSQIFAIKMYESFGFVESYRDEGIVLRGGEINDEIHMDLRPDHATRV